MAAKERKTENLAEQELRKVGFVDADYHFQGSEEDEIQRCLPSKRSGRKGAGHPEHIVRLNGDAADLVVMECKKDKKFHASAEGLDGIDNLKAADYAEDGVLWYMSGLKDEFNVIGLAVSGTEFPLKITTFRALRGSKIERLPNDRFLSKREYVSLLREASGYGKRTEEEIKDFAKTLHEFFRDQMELSDQLKPVIVSGILLALRRSAFEQGYRNYETSDELADAAYASIEFALREAKIPEDKRVAMMSSYEFIKTHQAVKDHLLATISSIYRHLFFALRPESSLDLLGTFYGEFLRYSGGDQKNLGIVLTPRHITELFAELAGLDFRSSVVLDICAGSGGFLIAAMAHMVKAASNDEKAIIRIKQKGLLGIELAPHMFTLACANMILRGDGKANMFMDNSLDPKVPTRDKITAAHPNVAFLNPPYSKKDQKKDELCFVKQALDMLDPNGICVSIIPVGCLIDGGDRNVQFKREILDSHTLLAVMSMPSNLFPKVGTVTAIAVFRSHQSHFRTILVPRCNKKGKILKGQDGQPQMVESRVAREKTWLAYWRDDGFVMSKNSRKEKVPGSWAVKKAKWVADYVSRAESDMYACNVFLDEKAEWLAEAYLQTNYDAIGVDAFKSDLKKFLMYKAVVDMQVTAKTDDDQGDDDGGEE